MSIANLFPSGTDLCQLAIATPPQGQLRDLDGPAPLKAVIIAVTVIMTPLSIVFTGGRLYTNFRKFSWADGFVFGALSIDVAIGVLICAFAGFSRHLWNIPLCWPLAQYMQFIFAYEILTAFGLFFAKSATLILFHQIFTISTTMRWAIRLGQLVNFLVYSTSIVVWCYTAAPHVGQSWVSLAEETALDPQVFDFRYAEGQAPVVLALDLYIFLLPLPTIAGLKMSTMKRIRLVAIFGTAVLGIVACTVNLAYRVVAVHNNDKTYLAAIIFISTQVEMNAAIIVAAMPAFSKFFRIYIWDSKTVNSLRSKIGNKTTYPERRLPPYQDGPNQPRTGRYEHRARRNGHQHGLDENWLLITQADVETECVPSIDIPARIPMAHTSTVKASSDDL